MKKNKAGEAMSYSLEDELMEKGKFLSIKELQSLFLHLI